MFEFVVSKKGLKESEARYGYIPSVFTFIAFSSNVAKIAEVAVLP